MLFRHYLEFGGRFAPHRPKKMPTNSNNPFHTRRHTFATRCIESQCDYKTVSAILGHSNVATTLNLYVHPNIHQKKKCIERMNKFLGIAEQ